MEKTPIEDSERFEDDECPNLGLGGRKSPSASECREDNSVMLNSKNITSSESCENDHMVSETQSVTSKEREKISAITISNNNLPLKGSKSKPGVILLGRGNSFSLGRSEVILLHNRPVRKSKDETKQGLDENHLDSIQEQSSTPPSPPPISEGVSSTMNPPLNGWKRMEKDTRLLEEVENVGNASSGIMDTDAFAKSLHQLWCKAEEVMTANEGRVLKVLEEFGIGEQAGGGGDDGGDGMQEEQVWQIVQENYHSQR